MHREPLPLGRHPVVHTTSLDEARELFGRLATPVRLERTDRKKPFAWRGNVVDVGSLRIGASQYGGGFVATSEPVEDIFAISLPFASAGAEACDGVTTVSVARGRTTWITSPLRPVTFRMATGYRALHLTIRRSEMQAALCALAGTKIATPVLFDPNLSLGSGAGASLQRLVRFVADEAGRDETMLSSPLITARFADAIIYGLLLGQPHNHSARLAPSSARATEPRHVRKAAEYLEAHAGHPIRMSDLSALTGVSIRSLQVGFQTYRGCSPMEFLRERRLDLARQRLLASANSTVTQVAMACGFEHIGRFSASYRARFGESPSETLRRASRR